MRSKDPVQLGEAEIIRETDLAVLVVLEDTANELWVPKSVIHDDSEIWKMADGVGMLVVEAWWANKQDLI
jgi:hypothetical protein